MRGVGSSLGAALLFLSLHTAVRRVSAASCESPEYLTACLQAARATTLDKRCQEACDIMQCLDDCYKEAFITSFYKQELSAKKALDLVRLPRLGVITLISSLNPHH